MKPYQYPIRAVRVGCRPTEGATEAWTGTLSLVLAPAALDRLRLEEPELSALVDAAGAISNQTFDQSFQGLPYALIRKAAGRRDPRGTLLQYSTLLIGCALKHPKPLTLDEIRRFPGWHSHGGEVARRNRVSTLIRLSRIRIFFKPTVDSVKLVIEPEIIGDPAHLLRALGLDEAQSAIVLARSPEPAALVVSSATVQTPWWQEIQGFLAAPLDGDWESVPWDLISKQVLAAAEVGSLAEHIMHLNRLNQRTMPGTEPRAFTDLLLGVSYQKQGQLFDARLHLDRCIASGINEPGTGFRSVAVGAEVTQAKVLFQYPQVDVRAAKAELQRAHELAGQHAKYDPIRLAYLWRLATALYLMDEKRQAERCLDEHGEHGLNHLETRANHLYARALMATLADGRKQIRDYAGEAWHYYATMNSLPAMLELLTMEVLADLKHERTGRPKAFAKLLITSALFHNEKLLPTSEGMAEILRLSGSLHWPGLLFVRNSYRLLWHGWPELPRGLSDEEKQFDRAFRPDADLIRRVLHELHADLSSFVEAPTAQELVQLLDRHQLGAI